MVFGQAPKGEDRPNATAPIGFSISARLARLRQLKDQGISRTRFSVQILWGPQQVANVTRKQRPVEDVFQYPPLIKRGNGKGTTYQ